MRRIPLRRQDGTVVAYALVSASDYDWLNRWRWCRGGKHGAYAIRYVEGTGRLNQRQVLMHVQIMGTTGVDHINGDGFDNRRGNLRSATQAQNAQNQTRLREDNTSGFRGIWQRPSGRWAAQGRLNGIKHCLGTYDTSDEAALAASMFRAEHMPYSEDARAA